MGQICASNENFNITLLFVIPVCVKLKIIVNQKNPRWLPWYLNQILIISHCAAKYSYLHISVASKPRYVNYMISPIDMSVEKRL